MKDQLTKMIQAAIDGETSCCEVHTKLKALETIIKSGLVLIQSGVLEESREFNKGEVYYGGTWQMRSSATLLKYDEDPVFTEYNTLASNRKKLLNAAWKQKNEGKGFFVTEYGEQIPVLPVKSPGKEIAVFKAGIPKKKENDGETCLAF